MSPREPLFPSWPSPAPSSTGSRGRAVWPWTDPLVSSSRHRRARDDSPRTAAGPCAGPGCGAGPRDEGPRGKTHRRLLIAGNRARTPLKEFCARIKINSEKNIQNLINVCRETEKLFPQEKSFLCRSWQPDAAAPAPHRPRSVGQPVADDAGTTRHRPPLCFAWQRRVRPHTEFVQLALVKQEITTLKALFISSCPSADFAVSDSDRRFQTGRGAHRGAAGWGPAGLSEGDRNVKGQEQPLLQGPPPPPPSPVLCPVPANSRPSSTFSPAPGPAGGGRPRKLPRKLWWLRGQRRRSLGRGKSAVTWPRLGPECALLMSMGIPRRSLTAQAVLWSYSSQLLHLEAPGSEA